MTKRPFVFAILFTIACSSSGPDDMSADGSGGAPSGGSTSAAGGASSAGGQTSSSGSGGALSTGGARTSGGAASGGGAPTGGASPSSGGASVGGLAATGGSTGSGGGASGGAANEGQASAGCGKAGRPSGGMVTASNSHFIAFPESYDGEKPFPVLLGFHGCGGSNRGDGQNPNSTEFINLTNNSELATDTIRAVPISSDSGGCWNYNNDISRVKMIYDDLLQSYCVDESRIYATGHSSGAQFITQILTKKADADHFAFAAVAPVASSNYGAHAVAVPAMYIQGKNDTERGGDGADAVARFRDANGCSMSSMAYSEVMGCQSGGVSVNPGCVSYSDCDVPTIWCSHNDPHYSGTSHGVPCFAISAMHDFFQTVP